VLLGPHMVLESPIKGFLDGALLICFLLMIGGSFAIFQETGAVEFGIRRADRRHHEASAPRGPADPDADGDFLTRRIGFRMSEEVIPFVIIFIPLAGVWGIDSIVGIAIPFSARQPASAAAFLQPVHGGMPRASRHSLYSGLATPGDLGDRQPR